MKPQNFKREFSAGCVAFKKCKVQSAKCKIVFLLGKHSGYHKWVLPKGLIEKGERGFETAVRETAEEVGVKVKVIDKKPIHKETYYYVADLKKRKVQSEKVKVKIENLKSMRPERRVEKYQEEGGEKTKIFKAVSFYLAEYVSGDPKDHDWEMEAADWFDYEKAQKLMPFKGEKEALKKAKERLENGGLQENLFRS